MTIIFCLSEVYIILTHPFTGMSVRLAPDISHKTAFSSAFFDKMQKNSKNRKKVFEKVVLLHPTETKSYGGQNLLQTI
ncbi:MAG: hypothetical protein IKP89_06085 [Bacteroidales bacterium]|nr:hypothetical protein [Bacteroidales bacterium]MBR4340164.1 hypothetical protein [Bacteroidales bacterium]